MKLFPRFARSRTARSPKNNRAQHRRRLHCEQLETRSVMSADAVLDWNAIAIEAVARDHTPSLVSSPDQGGPTKTARALGIVQAAVFDAVNAIDQSYTPYLVQKRAPSTASIDAAASQAAHDSLVWLYPKQKTYFDQQLVNSLAAIPNGRSENDGISIGSFVAAAFKKARESDGANQSMFYQPGIYPGQHRVDPLHPTQGFLTPMWGDVQPFTLLTSRQFRAAPPPLLTTKAYTDAFNEVKRLGGDGLTTLTQRTAEQTEIGIFWAYDGMPGVGTPPRLYNQIVRVLSAQQQLSEVENARLFALVNLAMADAGIAAWETKYVYDFWRPIVGIREADPGTGPAMLGDFNPKTAGDVNWTPLGAPGSNGANGGDFTPPFPAYVSGHAAFGAAAFRTLAQFFGRDNIPFDFMSDEFNGVTTDALGNVRLPVTRHFNSFSQAAQENADSRIYLGIHWRFDATAGIKQGNQIADWAFRNFLRPVGGFNVIGHTTAGQLLTNLLRSFDQNRPGHASPAPAFLVPVFPTPKPFASLSILPAPSFASPLKVVLYRNPNATLLPGSDSGATSPFANVVFTETTLLFDLLATVQ